MKFKQIFSPLMVAIAFSITSCEKPMTIEPLDFYYVSFADKTMDIEIDPKLEYGGINIPMVVETSPNTYHSVLMPTITVAEQTTAIYNVHYCFDEPQQPFGKQYAALKKDNATGQFFIRLRVNGENLTKNETLTIHFPGLKGMSLKPNDKEVSDTITITLKPKKQETV